MKILSHCTCAFAHGDLVNGSRLSDGTSEFEHATGHNQ